MTTVSQQQVYGANTGTTPTPAPVIIDRDPTTYDINYPVGKVWINKVAKNLFYLNGFNSQTGLVLADWVPLADIQTNVGEYEVVVGAADNSLTSVGPGSAGQILQSGGASANPQYSTSVYPASAGGSGTFIQSDGTDYTNSGYKFPTVTPSNGTILQSNGTDILASSYTMPSTVGAAGHILQSSGTGYADCTLNAGTGISLTNVAGSITINSNAPSVNSSFSAYLSTTQTNATGNNVYYPVICDQTYANNNSNYNTTTGVYTAPATGMYNFCGTVSIQNFLTAGGFGYALCTIFNATQNIHYSLFLIGPGAASSIGELMLSGAVLIKANQNDQIALDIQVSGGTQTIDVVGSSSPYLRTEFSGKFLG